MAGSDVQDQDITALASESLLLELTDQHLEWKFLGRHLGLTEGNLVDIERDNKGSSKEMKYQTLLQWKRTSGQRATIGKLAKALKKAGRTDLADYVMQVHGDTPRCPLLEWNGATAPANSQGANVIQTISLGPSQSGDESARYVSMRLQSNIGSSDQQWQFEPEELGGEPVEDQELALLAASIAKLHARKAFNDVQLFCSQLGIHYSVYNSVLMDKKQSNNEEKLYYVFDAWLMATSLTRNSLCKTLSKFDKLKTTSLCNSYVDIVHELFGEKSSESS